jgi:hypothetical protein
MMMAPHRVAGCDSAHEKSICPRMSQPLRRSAAILVCPARSGVRQMQTPTLQSGLLILALGLIVGGAWPRTLAAATYACGQRVASIGDSVAALRSRCGEPDRIVQLVNVYGAGVGQRWEYDRQNVTVLFTITDGRVTAIDEAR